jgi:hypothetical protein
MLSAVIDAGHQLAPDLWRRYLAIVLQGLRAKPASPEPLPTPPVPSGKAGHGAPGRLEAAARLIANSSKSAPEHDTRAFATRQLHKRLHTHRTVDDEQVVLNEKAPTCGASPEPSDGLEPSTPS